MFTETKRIQLLNIIFQKLTPTSYTNMHMTPYSFLRLEQPGLIKILYIFQEISEMTTLRMTNGMTKMSDNNVTLYFFPLIPKHFTHYLMHSRSHCCVCVCVYGRRAILCIFQKNKNCQLFISNPVITLYPGNSLNVNTLLVCVWSFTCSICDSVLVIRLRR